MSETSGFFLSQGGDRKYTPEWLASYIQALVTTGVYRDELAVQAQEGMTVAAAPGRAWVEGYLYKNDNLLPLQIATADPNLGRIDSVVLRLDRTARACHICVLQGENTTQPAAPAPQRTADLYDLKLAEVSVPAGTVKITQALIRDTRLDDAVCGVTVSAVQHIPTASFLSQMEAQFITWFAGVKDVLDQDAAGNLLQRLQQLSYMVQFAASDWTDTGTEHTLTVPQHVHALPGDTVSCRAFALVDGAYCETVWAALETYAQREENGDITIHYPGASGYAGRVVLSTYSLPPLTEQ